MNTSLRFRGFTMIEVVASLAILGLISTLIITSFSGGTRTQNVEGAALAVLSQLERARSLTLASKNNSVYGVYLATSSATIFKGTYSANNSENSVLVLPSGTRISNISLSGGGASITFSRLTGKTSNTGTVTISTTASTSQRTVTVYATGIAEMN